jgi:hypothetical protein
LLFNTPLEITTLGTKALTTLHISSIINDIALGQTIIGEHRQRVCTKCLKITTGGKIIVRDDCPSLTYCSHVCLRTSDDHLSAVGVLIDKINQNDDNSSSSLRERLGIFYNRKIL